MQLITVKDYCAQKDVSRQFVYEYIKKGKFEVVELPVFVRFQGHELEVGKQKFLKDPMTNQEKKAYWSGDVSDESYAIGLANDVTDNEEVRAVIQKMLLLDHDECVVFKKNVFEKYPIGSDIREELDLAMDKCADLMSLEMADVELKVGELARKVKAN